MIDINTTYNLIKEFFQIGMFSFGGGYSTLPFLLNLTHHYNWFSAQELTQMIAVATITPGPVAINVATYAGIKAGGILGAFIVTTSEVLPEFIIGLVVAKLLKKFSENFYVQSALWALKPTSCALLAYVALQLFNNNIVNNNNLSWGIIIFIILLLISILKPKNPLWYITFSAITGILFVYFNIINI